MNSILSGLGLAAALLLFSTFLANRSVVVQVDGNKAGETVQNGIKGFVDGVGGGGAGTSVSAPGFRYEHTEGAASTGNGR